MRGNFAGTLGHGRGAGVSYNQEKYRQQKVESMSHARSEYRDFMALTPDAYAAVLALGQVAGKAGMDKQLLELIKLRASQINGCAFCVQYHVLESEKLGVPPISSIWWWSGARRRSSRRASVRRWHGRRR
jgi:AhpD family alkylhydroperoxidase